MHGYVGSGVWGVIILEHDGEMKMKANFVGNCY